jgi:signal transduction histidine kinase
MDAPGSDSRWGRRIAPRVFLLVGLGMVGPLAVMVIAGWSTRAQLERQELADHGLLAAAVAARVDAALSADLVALQSAGTGAASLHDVRIAHPLFTSVLLLGPDGTVLAREPAGAGIDGAALVMAAGNKPGFTGEHAVIPLRSWRGDLIRVAAASLDRARLLALLHVPHLQGGMAIDLLDARGGVLAGTDRSSDAGELVASASVPVSGWTVRVRQSRAAGFFGPPLLALAGVLFCVALLFGWGAARSLTRPLFALTRAADRLTAGKLDEPMPALAEDEVGRLGAALERMRLALKEARDQLELRVAERTAQVRQLLGKVITAQEHERRRVARELHDETTQMLAALVIKLRARPGLSEETALAVSTLDAVHRLIVDLRPSVLDDLGLRSAIAWYADRHLRARGISVRCEFNGLDRRLPPEHETAIFRIVQEAITNIDKHAKAESVLIQTALRDEALTIDVEDDGTGFDGASFATPDRAGHGWGLLGMRERVEMLGGTLRIDSARGQGTHLALRVPLP